MFQQTIPPARWLTGMERYYAAESPLNLKLARQEGGDLKPIIFVLGLSGVGKTSTSDELGKKYALWHIDMDGSNSFKRIGLPNEWDTDIEQVDFALFADHVRSRIKDDDRGAILSFPTICRFTREQLDIAAACGICVVILWGLFKCCEKVRRERQEARGKGRHSARRYRRLNKPTFEMYSSREYERFRVWTLDPNCSHGRYKDILADITARIADQGTKLVVDA
jgi:adenylate kinase family enzyme